jgi:recombinational DNA repair ATPase RecF
MNLKRRVAELLQWREDHAKVHAMEQKAIEVAREEMTRRLNDHNDIANRISDCLRKDEFDRIHESLRTELKQQIESTSARVTLLEGARNEDEGRREPISGFIRWIATILAALVVAAASWFVGHFMK